MARIFLCHASEDKSHVRDAYQKLVAIPGFEPWLDEEELLPGQLWEEEIPRALKASDFILIFFSSSSVAKRGYVQREMKLALDAWKEIPGAMIHTIPVRLDECEIPEPFRRYHYANLFDPRGFDLLVTALHHGIEQRGEQVSESLETPPAHLEPTTTPPAIETEPQPTRPPDEENPASPEDTSTSPAIEFEAQRPPITVPSFSSQTQQAQGMLKQLGFDPGPIDGIWGRKTELEVRDYQHCRGLPETGVLDDETMVSLEAETQAPPQPEHESAASSLQAQSGNDLLPTEPATSPSSHEAPDSPTPPKPEPVPPSKHLWRNPTIIAALITAIATLIPATIPEVRTFIARTLSVSQPTPASTKVFKPSETNEEEKPNLLPTAKLSGPTSGVANQLLSFSAVDSSDPDGTINSYMWDYGDGTTADFTFPRATHRYESPGTYLVQLIIEDDKDATATTSQEVTISEAQARPLTADVLFDFDSSHLRPGEDGIAALEPLLQAMQEDSQLEATIIGHTDNQGNSDYLVGLSERQAQAVANYLMEGGIGTDRLKVEWHGASEPRVSNYTPEGRQQNRRVEIVVSDPNPPSLPKRITNSLDMEFVLIPAGTFTMGSPDSDKDADPNEKPAHQVTISQPFYMGTYEVTQSQWQAVMGNNPSKFKGDDRPVENVSWDDVQEFITNLNEQEKGKSDVLCRLPTEAEWEYAARAGTTTRYSFGDDDAQLKDYAWYTENSGRTHPVGKKKPNPWGIYDMHGNVSEWVWDKYGTYRKSPIPIVDPTGPDAGASRVVRGGYWGYPAQSVRAAYRNTGVPGNRRWIIGFRCLSSGVNQ